MFKKAGLSILTAVFLLTLTAGAVSATSVFGTDSPAMAAAGNGKLIMVYRGTDTRNPNALFWTAFNGTSWSKPSMIPGRYGVLESLASPALIFFDQKIQLVYAGVKATNSIYWASYDPQTGKWSDHEVIINTGHGDFKAVGAPALTALNGTLYMTYQGQEPKNTIYWASYSNGSWKNLMSVDAAP
jgi:hypothetical protein